MPTRHGLHGLHFHTTDDWVALAALPFAIAALGALGAMLCQFVPWS